jgi:hypothetical protein
VPVTRIYNRKFSKTKLVAKRGKENILLLKYLREIKVRWWLRESFIISITVPLFQPIFSFNSAFKNDLSDWVFRYSPRTLTGTPLTVTLFGVGQCVLNWNSKKSAFWTYGYIFERPHKAELQKKFSNEFFYLFSRIAHKMWIVLIITF